MVVRFGIPVLLAAAPWLIRRVGRDYEAQGQLTPLTAVLVYAFYVLHAGLVISPALRNPKPLPLSRVLAVALGTLSVLVGSGLGVAGARQFGSPEQVSGLEPGQLVTDGVYRYSRNPQNVGWGIALLGISLAGRSGVALVFTAIFFAVFRPYTPIEERHLERTFGEEYRRYRDVAPRFLGFPGGHSGIRLFEDDGIHIHELRR